VVIVGGGTAGWLAANHLATKLKPSQSNGLSITLIESPDIPTVGVGEGTVPSIRNTLREFGISETELIREADATLKQSIKFYDWNHNPINNSATDRTNQYHHLFDYPNIQNSDLTTFWLSQKSSERGCFAQTVSIQASIADRGLAPKLITHPEFSGFCDYAYHLDAGKFSGLLKSNAVERLGVKHCLDNVLEVQKNESGDIDALQCQRTGRIEGDIFIDCSGFASILLGQALGVPFIDKRKQLFVDHAVVAQVPYLEEDAEIPCFTKAHARKHGWIWDIGLSNRRGVGYVYSSDYASHDSAQQTLQDYLGPLGQQASFRKIPMKIGYREKSWSKNCIAIGLSQGFVEPLEATGLLTFDVTARMLANNFPIVKSDIPLLEERFNRTVSYAWERVLDFIKLHYFLSKRDDSQFWIDNRDPSTLPDSLKEKLQLWKSRPPTSYDFFTKHEIFNLDNYLYVLYGMNFNTNLEPENYLFNLDSNAKQEIDRLRQQGQELTKQLLPHRELIEKIKRFGLQSI
jgi:tryptophan halogenase